jgi:hypothetical protein
MPSLAAQLTVYPSCWSNPETTELYPGRGQIRAALPSQAVIVVSEIRHNEEDVN